MFSTIQVHNMNILRNLPGETPHHKINHNSETTIEKTNLTFSLKNVNTQTSMGKFYVFLEAKGNINHWQNQYSSLVMQTDTCIFLIYQCTMSLM